MFSKYQFSFLHPFVITSQQEPEMTLLALKVRMILNSALIHHARNIYRASILYQELSVWGDKALS